MRSRQVGRTTVEVYATRDVEAELMKRHAAAQSPLDLVTMPFGAEGREAIRAISRDLAPLDPTVMLP